MPSDAGAAVIDSPRLLGERRSALRPLIAATSGFGSPVSRATRSSSSDSRGTVHERRPRAGTWPRGEQVVIRVDQLAYPFDQPIRLGRDDGAEGCSSTLTRDTAAFIAATDANRSPAALASDRRRMRFQVRPGLHAVLGE